MLLIALMRRMWLVSLLVLVSLIISCGKPLRIERASFESHNQLVSDIQKLHTGLARYKERNGFYPTTEQGLQALVMQPSTDPLPSRWQQFTERVPTDPRGDPYLYRCPGVKD